MLLVDTILTLILILYINKKSLGSVYTLINPISLLCYFGMIIYVMHYLFYGISKYTFKILILSILVYTFFSRMFGHMLPPAAKHSIAAA